MTTWECPACKAQVQTLTKQGPVNHRCPSRKQQRVEFVKVGE